MCVCVCVCVCVCACVCESTMNQLVWYFMYIWIIHQRARFKAHSMHKEVMLIKVKLPVDCTNHVKRTLWRQNYTLLLLACVSCMLSESEGRCSTALLLALAVTCVMFLFPHYRELWVSQQPHAAMNHTHTHIHTHTHRANRTLHFSTIEEGTTFTGTWPAPGLTQ